MPSGDGHVIIKTDLDNSQLEKEYAKTVKKIEKLESGLSGKKTEKSALEQQSASLSVELDKANAKLYEMQNASKGAFSADAIKAQQETVASLQARFNAIDASVQKYTASVARSERELAAQRNYAGELQEKIDEAANAANSLENAFAGVNDRVGKLGNRLSKLVSRVMMFSVFTSVLRSVRDYIGDVASTNDEASAAFARLKGALLTMIQPLVSVVLPVLTTFVNLLTAVIGKIASFAAWLGGTSVEAASNAAKALHKETNALNGAGAAAKKASKSLAGFDEINTLAADSSGSSGGGASADVDFSWADGVTEDLSQIADYILLIGVGLAAWKLSGALPGILGELAGTVGGLMVSVGGLMLLWEGLTDAWENGVDWTNLLEMIGGLAAAVVGLYIAFGPVAAAIALIVGGIALLVTGFQDAMNNGWNLQNTLLAIAGIIATGLGISLLTGSMIPALIAGIAALLLAFTTATGHGDELLAGIQEMCQGFADFFTGIFSGDIEKALLGIQEIFHGLGTAVNSILFGLRDTILSFLDWLNEKTGGKLSPIIETAKNFVYGFFSFLTETVVPGIMSVLQELMNFLVGVFTGDWDAAWAALQNGAKSGINLIISAINGFLGLITDGLNWMIQQLNKISIEIPSWIPGLGGKRFGVNIPEMGKIEIPQLAQGAVIPPNREFLAVLGDQKHGTNIEAPLSTIQEAVALVMEDMTGGMMAGFEATVAVLQEILEAILGIEVGDEVIAKAVQRYQSKMAVVKGGN